jgi:transposase InsO family protein
MNQLTTGLTAVLRAGGWLVHDGERHQVVELCGRRVLLQSVTGALRQVDIAWLLAHPTTRIGDGGDSPGPSLAAAFGSLDAEQDAELTAKLGHVQEVLTGYQHGSAELAQAGEPRRGYAPGTPKMARYQAKAAELGVSVMTVRRWVAAFASDGPAGLLRNPSGRGAGPLGRTDPRWVDMARAVLAEHVPASRPTRDIVLARIQARLVEAHGAGVVAVPARSTADPLLRELSRGTGAFEGATRAKRSIANRPSGVYGRLRATRPGEYVLLDTTRLDVFAMEPVTCRWVQAELTAAMDLYSRCITGLRLTPISTKAVDVAGVLYETVRPRADDPAAAPADGLAAGREPFPYHGTPSIVVVDARKLVDNAGRPLLPAVAAEAIVYDHGKVYLSNHVQGVCERLGISLQPARPQTPTDKSPLERWFATLADQLLVALPGYKGADVHSRGADVEQQAYFFLDELEQVIREWIDRCYHLAPHRGLAVPEVPGLEVSPLEMFEHGVTRAGQLTIPARPGLRLPQGGVAADPPLRRGGQHAALQRPGAEPLPQHHQPLPRRPRGQMAVFDRPRRHQPHLVPGPRRQPLARPGVGARPGAGQAVQSGSAGLRAGAGGHDPPLPRHQAGAGRAARPLGRRPDRQPHRAAHGRAPVPGAAAPAGGDGHLAGPPRRP